MLNEPTLAAHPPREDICAPTVAPNTSQPFRAEPPMGCSGESPGTCNGGEGFGVAFAAMTTAARQENARPLSERYSEWRRACLMDSWMSGLISRGYSLQFASPPPRFNGILETVLSPQEHCSALQLELQELLMKGVISAVPHGEESQGFYSRYFLVPKKTGGVRPILDLSLFNKSIMERRFHMLTIKQVLECVHQDDWFTSIDLKDAYFHVPIIPKHMRFLRFSFQGIQYQYNRLPFGYSLAPRTFSRCVETALEPLRRTGMRVLFYLDDLLLLARSKEEAAMQTMTLVVHLSNLGFAINWKKSSPLPSQQVIYLGVELNSVSMRARLSQQRAEALTALLRRVTPHSVVTALSVMQLLGMMSAGHVTVPLGLLHMRRLQRWFIRLHVDPKRQRRRMVSVPPSVGPDLAYWGNPHVLSAGVPLGRVTSHISVFTDASLSGWGGTCLTETVGGQWPAHMSLHINALELLTVWKVIQHFAPLLQKSARADSNRQQGGCSLHKPPGRSALGAAFKHSQEAAALGSHSSALHQSNVHPRRAKQRGRHHVEGRSSSGGLESPPRADQTDLAQVRRGRSGPIRRPGNRALRAVVFPELPGRPPSRSGRVCTPSMAHDVSLCFSPGSSDSAVPGPGSGRAAVGDFNSPRAHGRFMVSVPAAADFGQPVETSVVGRRSLPGRGSDQVFPSDRPTPVGLAPERERLEGLGSLAGSGAHYSGLLVDRDLAFSTVKTYAAAISSCHEGFG
ncbi:hypothetical protein L3Q82_014572 [Scortum barcoo]|uniref:Uncharacterized protein n=1 Tax=Scortum barcoo TaxID=214431 RepID=A0ACB8VXG7_9TELE|nr:hypothetical protein L3Q82_014572 [Scortum barcoo]